MSFGDIGLKAPKLDPAIAKKIPEITNNAAIRIIEGTPPGAAFEDEIKDQIKIAVMNEIEHMIDNKLVMKVAEKMVDNTIDKLWGSIKEKLKIHAEGAPIATEPQVVSQPYQPTPQYQEQPTYYQTTPAKSRRSSSGSTYGSVSITLGAIWLVVFVVTLFLTIRFGYLTIPGYFFSIFMYSSIFVFPAAMLILTIIYGAIGISKDRKIPMGIIGLNIGIVLLIILLIIFLTLFIPYGGYP